MLENLFDDRRVFDTAVRRIGDHFNGTATMLTSFNVDIEYSLQPLRPSHRDVTFSRDAIFFPIAYAAPSGPVVRR